MVLFKATGGPLVDRVGPRRMAITADVLSMLAVGLIPVLHKADHLTFPLLLLLVAVGGALRGPGDAAVTAMIPSLSESAGVPYERVTGLGSAIERGATMVGAAIAGGLVATIGAANAVAVDAVSFGVCAVVLSLTTRGARPGHRGRGRADTGRAVHVVPLGAARRMGLPAPRPGADEPLPDDRGHQRARPRVVGRAAAGLGPRLRGGGRRARPGLRRVGRRLDGRLARGRGLRHPPAALRDVRRGLR